MSPERHARLYRLLTALYPGLFRREYRDDLVSLFARQVVDDGAASCWLRVLRDLAISVPVQQLEVRMHRPTTKWLAATCVVIAAASTVLAAVVGSSVYGLALLLAALAAIALAIIVRRADRTVTAITKPQAWKKLLGSGVLILSGLIVLLNLGPAEDGIDTDGLWYVMMLTLITSVLLIIVGVIGGVASRVRTAARSH